MGAIAHYLEEEGLATTQISLVREHTETIKPPRALCVPFELGRPFGSPNDTSLQMKVVVRALKLLDAAAGPVLDDFPEEESDAAISGDNFVCPVSFAVPISEMSSVNRMLESFRNEAANMKGWYDLALIKQQRTTAGISGLNLDEIVLFFASFIEGDRDACPFANVPVAAAIRMAAEDLKAIYCEGLSARPGKPGDSKAIADWFWGETAAAQIINAIREICLGLAGNEFQMLGKLLLVPRVQLHRFKV